MSTECKTTIRITELKAEIAQLEKELEEKRNRLTSCPCCGSKTNASTQFPRRYCRQENGICGVLWIYHTPEKYDSDASFNRTSFCTVTGAVDPCERKLRVGVRSYWIKDKRVEREEYESCVKALN